MGLQAAGQVARGLEGAMLRNEQARRQQEERAQQEDERELQEILQLLQLEQMPGVEAMGPERGPAESTEADFSTAADALSGVKAPDQGEGEGEGQLAGEGDFIGQLAARADILPPGMEGEGGGGEERTEMPDLLSGFTVEDSGEALSDTAEELGTVELAGEERRIFFDPAKAAEASTAESRRKQAQQQAAFDILKARKPDQFGQFVPGFDYIGELDEVMSEEREAAREAEAGGSEDIEQSRKDRAFRLLRQGQSIEQVSDATGLPTHQVGDLAKDVRGLEEEDRPTENVMDLVNPRDPFEEEIARRIADGQTRGEILEAIQRDVAKAAQEKGTPQDQVSREIDRLTEKATDVFSRLDENRDVTVSGDFESLQGLFGS